VVRDGIGGADAATALLRRRPPSAAGPLLAEGETVAGAAIRLATSLRRSYLPLQGPPGTGKTYTAAEQILALVAQGRTAGLTGPSHAVISQLIDTLCRRASVRGRQEILGEGPFAGSGLRVVEVAHEGNTNASPEEADEVARLAQTLAGCSWRDRDGAVRPVGGDGILIVTPYNAQIRAIQDALAARGLTGFRVGTVDKFQGREAPVVIYSMATSSAEEAPRGLEFLYDGHRLNVATSRARAMAIIVASPDLIRVSCRTPQQMTLVNALCRAWEEPGSR
jgi:hypothetical protein